MLYRTWSIQRINEPRESPFASPPPEDEEEGVDVEHGAHVDVVPLVYILVVEDPKEVKDEREVSGQEDDREELRLVADPDGEGDGVDREVEAEEVDE